MTDASMSDNSRTAYLWVGILGLILTVVGVILELTNDYSWIRVGTSLVTVSFAILLFAIVLMLYAKT